MRTTLLSLAAGASLLCGTFAAQAMPAGPIAGDGASLILVSGGCGPALPPHPVRHLPPATAGFMAGRTVMVGMVATATIAASITDTEFNCDPRCLGEGRNSVTYLPHIRCLGTMKNLVCERGRIA